MLYFDIWVISMGRHNFYEGAGFLFDQYKKFYLKPIKLFFDILGSMVSSKNKNPKK